MTKVMLSVSFEAASAEFVAPEDVCGRPHELRNCECHVEYGTCPEAV